VKTIEIVEENLYITNLKYQKETHSCTKCGKQLTFFIAYIPSVGDACMDCYIEAAKIDEANTLP
jgi:NMD protein affecting ribosome stability and mRNA decay